MPNNISLRRSTCSKVINASGMEGTRPFTNAGRSQLTSPGPVSCCCEKKSFQYQFHSFHRMLFNKFTGLFLLFFTIIAVACPISERAIESDGLEARSYYSRHNLKIDPNLKTCKKLKDCTCPKPNSKVTSSVSCINGLCKCNDKAVIFFGNMYMKAIIAVGNAPITKAIGNLMAGIADIKEVIGTIAGAFLGPEAKVALKAALNVIPDTGPSHIDKAAKTALLKAF